MARAKPEARAVLRDMFDEQPEAPAESKAPKPKARSGKRKHRAGRGDPASTYFTIDEVAGRYRVAKATVWRWVKNDPDFPEPIKLSAGTSRWTEEQLRLFERAAAKRGRSKEMRRGRSGKGGLG